MYRNEREQEILTHLEAEGYASVKQLSTMLYTSESSIRRDLTSLEKQGLVTRSYGGVTYTRHSSTIPAFSLRAHHNIAAKKIMAQKAAKFIQDGDIVFLDQSSSAFYVAYEVIKKQNITVVTNNIEIITLLARSETEVISAGGKLSKNNRNCLIGDDAHRIFREIRANVMFFSTKTLSDDGIIYDCDREEVCLRNTMLANARHKIYLCDKEKIGKCSGYRQCLLDNCDCMVSEVSPDLISSRFPDRDVQFI